MSEKQLKIYYQTCRNNRDPYVTTIRISQDWTKIIGVELVEALPPKTISKIGRTR